MDEEYDLPEPEEVGLPAPQSRPPQQEQFQPPGLMEPFSQSDDLQLQRLQAGLATVRQQVWDGDLHEQEGDAYQRQIMKQAVPLAARKKQAQRLERQNQLEEALHTSAMQKAVEQQNAAFDANGFGARASYLRNPQTGQTAVFFQKKPGEFEPVDFSDSADPYQPSADGQGGVYVSGEETSPQPFDPKAAVASADPMAGVGTGGAEATDGAAAPEEGASPTKGEAEVPANAPRADAEMPASGTERAGGPMTIVNGNERSVYENGRLTEHTTLDGTPIKGPGKEGDARFGLNKETLDYIHSIATAGSMHLPAGVQRNAMYSHLYQRGVMQAVQEAAVEKRNKAQQERDARVEAAKEQRATTATQTKQVETDYSDAIRSHPIKDYADAAEPHKARMNDVMDHFALLHPDDPRVVSWNEKRDAAAESAVKRDPAKMSLPQLAAAAVGPKANVQKMLDAAEKDIRADGRPVPENTAGGATGIIYNPTGVRKPGPMSAMDPADIKAEAERQVRADLTRKVTSQREAREKAPGTSPAPVQGGQGPQPKQLTPDDLKQSALLPGAKPATPEGPGLIHRILNTPREHGFRQ